MYRAIVALISISLPLSAQTLYLSSINTGSNTNIVAPGSIVSINGSALGPDLPVQATALPLTNALGGTSMQVTAAGVVYDAWMLSAQYNNVRAIMPSNVPVGSATLTLKYNGQTNIPQTFTVVKSSFAIFTQNGSGYGPASTSNGLTTPAQPGQTVTLYGTGLGAALDGKDNIAPKVGNIGADISITVGGAAVAASYAGRSPQYPGLDQINFQIPPATQITLGCYVPVSVSTDNSISSATLSISQTSTCSHPLGLNAAPWQNWTPEIRL